MIHRTSITHLLIICSLFLLGICVLTGCTASGTPEQPTDGTDTLPESADDGTAAPTETAAAGTTAPDSAAPTEAPTEPETAPFEDPALNVFPTEGQNIEIGIFWEPPVELKEAENYDPALEYDWIRDANVTFVEMTNYRAHPNMEAELRIKQLCYERGLGVSWITEIENIEFSSFKGQKLRSYLEGLAQDEAIVGVHMKDEPSDPWSYAEAIRVCHEVGLTPRLNLLPNFASWIENFQGYYEEAIIAAGKENYGYLSYDQYPFPVGKGAPSSMYNNLDQIRKIGLKHDVKTAFYIQSIGDGVNARATNADEIRLHVSAGLAYGIKSYTYFTWWTTGFCDPADYAIISPYGEKTEVYDGVAEVNAQTLRVGRLLYGLDALEVYHYGQRDHATVALNKSNPVICPTGGKYIVSFMQDKTTGRDYIMLVNKNFKDEVTTEFSIGPAVTHLYDCTNGSYEELDISSGSVTFTFKPGAFVLLAVGQHDNIVDITLDADEHNLALNKAVAVGQVNPGSGWYAYCATDGRRHDGKPAERGFRSSAEQNWIEVDLGRVTDINRVDIYPTGSDYSIGVNFPTEFTLEVSADRQSWVTVALETGYDGAQSATPSFVFDTTAARYVRLNVTAGTGRGWEIAEIEIFHDDGTLPAPEQGKYLVAGKEPAGTDVAKGKPCTASSELNIWPVSNVTSGDELWSSALGRHKTSAGTEWVCVDLQIQYTFDTLYLRPRSNDEYFPEWVSVQVSNDGKNFTDVYYLDYPEQKKGAHDIEIKLDKPVKAQYVRLYTECLRGYDNPDGYLFQLNRIQIINK